MTAGRVRRERGERDLTACTSMIRRPDNVLPPRRASDIGCASQPAVRRQHELRRAGYGGVRQIVASAHLPRGSGRSGGAVLVQHNWGFNGGAPCRKAKYFAVAEFCVESRCHRLN